MTAPRAPVGRAGELEGLRVLAAQAALGCAGTMVITGEPGIGKTTLVHEAADRVKSTAEVLWTTCLPLTSLAVPLLPLTTALRRWSADRGETVPDLGRPDLSGISNAPAVFDEWLDETCARRCLLLVVDDLHWADQSTLDVLHYLIAGPRTRRLAIVATIRSSEVDAVHPLRRWLADVRRLPAVTELTLGRLDRVGTREQIAQLVDASPFESLVDDVFNRSRGNPYVTALLLRGASPQTRSLPDRLPSELRDALAHMWRRLSASTQRLTQLLAVSGRPASADDLTRLCAAVREQIPVVSALHEAVDAVVVEEVGGGSWWFVHPLMAEILESALIPEERRQLHSATAELLVQQTTNVALAEPTRIVVIADHYWRARQPDAAYHWALLAADAAERAGGPSEMLRLLRRALELLPQAGLRDIPRQQLLDRIRRAAQRTGAAEEEYQAVEEQLSMVDDVADPLLASELLVRRAQLRLMTGRQFSDLANPSRGVALAAGHPNSAELAMALAELAHQQLWQEVDSGPATAAEAVAVAHRSGSPQALAYALTARVMARVMKLTESDPAVTADGMRAQELAFEARDFFCVVHAALWTGNSIDISASPDVLRLWSRRRESMIAAGAPHSLVAWLAACEAVGRLGRGEVEACQQMLRSVLGSNPGPMADTISRLVAARLSARQGRLREADAHLLRADELFAEHSGFLAFEFDAVRAELALAGGDCEGAVTAAMAGVESDGVPPTSSELLLPIAARALADLAQRARDHGQDDSEYQHRAKELKARHPQTLEDQSLGVVYLRLLDALNAVYDAEILRALDGSDAFDTWRYAAELSAKAEDPWTEAYACWRTAEAGLRRTASRDGAGSALRRAHALAKRLGARPLLTDIEALATAARVPLPSGIVAGDQAIQEISGLTMREREVLAHVVAGHTYAEIARALFISEKTVSVHISNLLAKTGTTNRIELAQMANRLNATAADRSP
jgi:DNA-binding CsgD family transcriptional regulator